LINAWSAIHQSIIDQAIYRRLHLNACDDDKGKQFECMPSHVASHLSTNCCSSETFIRVLLQNFIQVLTFKF